MCGLRRLSRFKHPDELTQHFKTLTILKVFTTIICAGFNVETTEYKNMSLTMWDIGGQDKIWPLMRHYFQNTQGEVVTESVGQCVVMCVALLL